MIPREHHLLVFVPCWKLRQVHAVLLGKDLGRRMERATSYAEVLACAALRVSRGTRSGR
jgi:fatty acid desaturase